MITVEEAIEGVEKNVGPTNKKEYKDVLNSIGQVLFEDAISPIDMPPFRQSAMDGYALCLHRTETYTVIGEVKAGDGHHPKLKAGEAVRIFTGAPVPDDANAVVMQEKVTIENNSIKLRSIVNLNENIRPLGEQVKKGAVALKKGTRLTPAAIGYLTSLGVTGVTVFNKPSVAIVVTGNELVEAGQLTYGKIYESNSGMLFSALSSQGYADVTMHKVDDDYKNTLAKLDKVISENDVVLITGGISVGEYDFVGKALQELAVKRIFYKVKQKPGKPLFFGKKESILVFALPGNPAAALSCFYVYVYPALQKLSGDIGFSFNTIEAKSNSDFFKKGDRAQFLKAVLKDGRATILEGQGSSMLQTFALANALVYVPQEVTDILINDTVEVICLPV